MSYERRARTRKRRKILRLGLISFIIIYLVFRSLPSLLGNFSKTTLPEKYILVDKTNVTGVFIKNEYILRAKSGGQLTLLVHEGERISSGVEIANINQLQDTSQLRQELAQIENNIQALNKPNKDLLLPEKQKVEKLKSKSIEEIQKTINLGDFSSIHELKEDLILYDSKIKNTSLDNTLLGQGIDNLSKKRDELLLEINNNNIRYYSPQSGIVSYNIDGYEETFIPRELENYKYNNLEDRRLDIKTVDAKDQISLNEPILKIIDNFEYYIALKINNREEIEKYEKGQTMNLYLSDRLLDLKGKIVSINSTEDKTVIIIKLNTYLHDLYDLRFAEMDIIHSRTECLKLPTKSIVDIDGQKGVYLKEHSGIVRFRPVIILGIDGQFTLIKPGDGKGNIVIEDGQDPVRTVNLYDEIFINTRNIKDGNILN